MNKLLVATLEAKFHVFDVHLQHPKDGFPSLDQKVLDVCFVGRRGSYKLSIGPQIHYLVRQTSSPKSGRFYDNGRQRLSELMEIVREKNLFW